MRRLPHGEGLYMFVFHSNEALNESSECYHTSMQFDQSQNLNKFREAPLLADGVV